MSDTTPVPQPEPMAAPAPEPMAAPAPEPPPAAPYLPPPAQGAAYPPPPPPTGQLPPAGPPPEPTPRPAMAPSDERTWAMLAHLGSFVAAYVALGLLAPLLVLLLKGNDSAYVREHAVESLNFQITALIAAIVSAVLILVIIGIFMLIALAIVYLIWVIQASMAANRGEYYRYPICWRIVK